ncbi:MAG: SDR family oxidoreductase [Candidatus Bathyarchaeota archaeon]|nr:MAG: SDR family oxidoreductase [Candidatus Bathyarchaeota archaeon]
MDLGLKNRTAVVTGSSRGIGKAIARGLAGEGVKTVVCARDKETLKETAKEIETSTKTQVLPIQTDLQNRREIRSLVKITVESFGGIDILVNNTGGPPSSLFLETSEEDWRDAVDQLLMSVVNCCLEVVPYMQRAGWGRIVNMTSFAAKQPIKSLILSNSIRSGILGLTKSLSNELAEYGILVNAVCPGWTLTGRIVELAKSRAEKTGESYADVVEEWAKSIPLKRLARPEEIANLVVFLTSEKASYVTGTTIQVDGGFIKSLI